MSSRTPSGRLTRCAHNQLTPQSAIDDADDTMPSRVRAVSQIERASASCANKSPSLRENTPRSTGLAVRYSAWATSGAGGVGKTHTEKARQAGRVVWSRGVGPCARNAAPHEFSIRKRHVAVKAAVDQLSPILWICEEMGTGRAVASRFTGPRRSRTSATNVCRQRGRDAGRLASQRHASKRQPMPQLMERVTV